MERLLAYIFIATVPNKMVRLERMLDYRNAGLQRYHCTSLSGTQCFAGTPFSSRAACLSGRPEG